MALTEKDLENIKQLVEITFEEKLDEVLERKLEEKLSHLPSKEVFYAQMDKIMAEHKAIRQEPVSAHQVSNHEDRITVLETRVSPG